MAWLAEEECCCVSGRRDPPSPVILRKRQHLVSGGAERYMREHAAEAGWGEKKVVGLCRRERRGKECCCVFVYSVYTVYSVPRIHTGTTLGPLGKEEKEERHIFISSLSSHSLCLHGN